MLSNKQWLLNLLHVILHIFLPMWFPSSFVVFVEEKFNNADWHTYRKCLWQWAAALHNKMNDLLYITFKVNIWVQGEQFLEAEDIFSFENENGFDLFVETCF